ncbi:MAG: HD domain-containing protein, partial [Balneolaceae bacterium]
MSRNFNASLFRDFILSLPETDAAHDLAHTERVVSNAERLLTEEEADPEIVLAAAWLHDCVVLSKDHPDRKNASRLAAEKAEKFLGECSFPPTKISEVVHAIEAHSFSAGVAPKTIEAKIVQDADRLDALGAIGIARCLMVGGALNRPLYHPGEPLPQQRTPDDTRWT